MLSNHSSAEMLRKQIEETDWKSKFTNHEATSFHFRTNNIEETIALARHFAQAVRLDNHPPNIARNTLRVGMLALSGVGKSSFVKAIFAQAKNFIKTDSNRDEQIAGDDPDFGHMCRADLASTTSIIRDYICRDERPDTGGVDFIEHVQQDWRNDKLHGIFIISAVDDQGDEREIKFLCGPELPETKGVQQFLREATRFIL
jgi:hypothetical protein